MKNIYKFEKWIDYKTKYYCGTFISTDEMIEQINGKIININGNNMVVTIKDFSIVVNSGEDFNNYIKTTYNYFGNTIGGYNPFDYMDNILEK